MIGGRSFYYHYYWMPLDFVCKAISFAGEWEGLAAFHSILAGQRAAGGIITRGAGSSRDRF